jgi:hypothetical protein
MSYTKIINIEDLNDLQIVANYPGAPDQSQYGGPWGDSSTHKHVAVPGGMNEKAVVPSHDAASADHGGVTFTADNLGEAGNDIILFFNGNDDIDTIIADHNTNNPSDTVSHNGTGTDVLALANIQLAGGGINLVEDQAKLDQIQQDGRNQKLTKLRELRDAKALAADHEINKHSDSDANASSLEATWRTYRVDLRNITDSYKDGNGDGTSALDGFALDMSDFNAWPTEPS